jgi:hypothetical protein
LHHDCPIQRPGLPFKNISKRGEPNQKNADSGGKQNFNSHAIITASADKLFHPSIFNKAQLETRIESSHIMTAATLKARDGATDSTDARKITAAIWTSVKEPPSAVADWKRQLMACGFTNDSQLATGHPPFRAMRKNAAAASARLRDQMGQFVPQRAIDFRCAVIAQARIQQDRSAARIGPPGSAAQSPVPFHMNLAAQTGIAERPQNFPRSCLQFKIASGTK